MSIIRYGGRGGSYAWTRRAFPEVPAHSFSLAVSPLEVLDLEGNLFSHGTAFVYRLGSTPYLVTAWHVVSGRDFFSGKLNREALIPRSFRFYVPSFRQEGNIVNLNTTAFLLELTEEASALLAQPPEVYDARVDVAVARLPLTSSRSGNFTSGGLNEFEWGISERTEAPIGAMIGADVFVLGYPLSTYEGLRTPIWKRGSLASEPAFEIDPKCAFLIDVNSTGGMSGGPIIRRVAMMTAQDKLNGIIAETYDEAVIGVYSGRTLSSADKGFSLGYGWPIDVVHAIIETGQCFSGPMETEAV